MPRRALLLFVIFAAARLSAQEVSVGELQWLTNPAPAEPLPKRGGRARPTYPTEMRSSDVIGYVTVAQSVAGGPGGQPSLMYAATHAPFLRAVREEFSASSVRELSGRKKLPPDAAVWQAFIFNPKSAGPKLRDATPRLLAIVPIVTHVRLGGAASATAWVKVSLDATGAVTNAEPEAAVPEAVRALVSDTVREWKFAPARRDGQPVAAEISVPVVAQGTFSPTADASTGVVRPRPLGSPPPPSYPSGLLSSGLRGDVLIAFDVEVDGRIVNPVVARSSHPAFEPLALERLRSMKFAPGTRDGQPEKMSMKMGFAFEPPGAHDVARVEAPPPKKMAKLPEEIRFDVAPRPRTVVLPVYPYALLRNKIRGHAQAALTLDEQGRVVRAELVEASHPEFGQALLAAVRRFEFEPALKAGHPTPTIITHRQEFRPYGFDQIPAAEELDLLAREIKKPQGIVGAEKLDAPLAPVSRASPLAPGGRGHAVVEFLVDETGHARLPRIVESTAPEFGYAAVQAASAWQFAPPRAGGKAVVVRVQAPFNFDATAAP